MKKTKLSTGSEIAYFDEGEGHPIVLIHGFASNASVNWLGPGWIDVLNKAGYRVIALDNRGHGESTLYYTEDAYRLPDMAKDVGALIEELDLARPHVMGYSMGSRITATLAFKQGDALGKIILAGNGYNMVEGGFDSSQIRDGLLAESFEAAPTEIGRNFRFFAEQTESNLKALAACIMGGRSHIDASVFEAIANDTLVIIGEEDDIAQNGDKLASIMQNARFEPIPRRNHMNAVGDKVYKEKVIAFLQE